MKLMASGFSLQDDVASLLPVVLKIARSINGLIGRDVQLHVGIQELKSELEVKSY